MGLENLEVVMGKLKFGSKCEILPIIRMSTLRRGIDSFGFFEKLG